MPMDIQQLPWTYAQTTLNSHCLYRHSELVLQNLRKPLNVNVNGCKKTILQALELTCIWDESLYAAF